jgi:hypothetical protein
MRESITVNPFFAQDWGDVVSLLAFVAGNVEE